MSSCCPQSDPPSLDDAQSSHCHDGANKFDYLLWVSLAFIAIFYVHHGWFEASTHWADWYAELSSSVFELMNAMWWGIGIGVLMVALLGKIPREFVLATLGQGHGVKGVVRATLAGVLLDLCNHGILMVGAKLYEKGVSLGQVMAFLIASPWNSLSLTIILVSLIGLGWTVVFVILSAVVAVVSGLIFQRLVGGGILPANPNQMALSDQFSFWREARVAWASAELNRSFFVSLLRDGITSSQMVVRWILFGVLLASLIRALVDVSVFSTYFGPSVLGLVFTLLAATIIEVCSEGSTPIAADLLTRAQAPGNSFAFLMTGAATDYTEIMVLKETTRSWKIALFLPLITVPQVLVMAWLLNGYG